MGSCGFFLEVLLREGPTLILISRAQCILLKAPLRLCLGGHMAPKSVGYCAVGSYFTIHPLVEPLKPHRKDFSCSRKGSLLESLVQVCLITY